MLRDRSFEAVLEDQVRRGLAFFVLWIVAGVIFAGMILTALTPLLGLEPERIQSTVANTIPLWKSQMVIAMGMQHAESALNAQKAVTDMTNELLRSNAERLKVGTIETAKEAERGVVDIETIRTANTALIDTLNEVQKIQREGAQKRAAAAIELGRLEKELRDKVLEINR